MTPHRKRSTGLLPRPVLLCFEQPSTYDASREERQISAAI
ncbi:hypothetical protein BRO54_3240 [Geobacillus proteiniphilus]|uniref:Uncharacterized protein n=1 Tax=Geobacillus proteiniphilus TaxID=860353 RepID=A0A1Q5SPA8_9BACL|nr:hypothetical protein BRO54_3240 [Geobacillus proteiniphilus]